MYCGLTKKLEMGYLKDVGVQVLPGLRVALLGQLGVLELLGKLDLVRVLLAGRELAFGHNLAVVT